MCRTEGGPAPTARSTDKYARSSPDRNDSKPCPPPPLAAFSLHKAQGPKQKAWCTNRGDARLSGVSKKHAASGTGNSSSTATDVVEADPADPPSGSLPTTAEADMDRGRATTGDAAFNPDAWLEDDADGTGPATHPHTQDAFLPSPSFLSVDALDVDASFDLSHSRWTGMAPSVDEATQQQNSDANYAIDPAKLLTPSVTTDMADLQVPLPLPESSAAQAQASFDPGRFVICSYYSFIEGDFLAELPAETMQFLETKHCLHLPTPGILNEFVRQYFLHVHPNIPMLDEGDFWDMYSRRGRGRDPGRGISLFLLQAMIFASSSFVSSETLRRLGLRSTREARTRFYHAAKTLYQHDDSNDPVTTAQALLLLSYQTSPRRMRANSYWLALSIHSAREAGADCYQDQNHSPARRRTLKRLWWSCILRDRVVSLGVRRPLMLSAHDFDFSLPCLEPEDFDNDLGRSRVVDAVTQHALLTIIVAKCKLALALTDLLMLVLPRKAPFAPQCEAEARRCLARMDQCGALLDSWYQDSGRDLNQLKATAKGRESQSQTQPQTRHPSLTLHVNVTFIYYQYVPPYLSRS
ncbi:hypothetical protein A1O3_08219 [Capronia epimyces CBS 606.96]|uniref:Xylanolytic transcriptional activator regulatory domain-containing protein n=1 Tax=Capronia epimyces CBS 606.96 TaxID=1182542 RepID=W9YC79_9EURO|nr:uncharacterized protein A1O3_08219 [Capronia epimyces CBS 606.96]EXJ79934.1 hypothetical protein A1O3_08219 [Capronia epimyces CBS 606.96]